MYLMSLLLRVRQIGWSLCNRVLAWRWRSGALHEWMAPWTAKCYCWLDQVELGLFACHDLSVSLLEGLLALEGYRCNDLHG